MQPIWSLLKSRQNDPEWNPALRGALASTQAGRQWPQTRVFVAGWSGHKKCLACLQAIVEEQETGYQRQARIELLEERGKGAIVQVIASEAQVMAAPVGDLFHRSWECKLLEPDRVKYACSNDRARMKEGWGRGKVAWERALVPLPPPPPHPPAAEATFHWNVKPNEDLVSGVFYLDGSALDGPSVELMRCGWSFVAVDVDGTVLASAYGATPPWVVDIGGAEAWALLQATGTAFPGACSFVSDCKVMVDMLHGGRQKALAGSSSHARVYALIITAIDDTPVECIICMPAHQHPGAAGKKAKSNNELLTMLDIEANDEADKLAKKGGEDHRVPYMVRQAWKRCYAEA